MPVWSFIAVTAPLVLSPGATTAVVLRNSIGGGGRAGVAYLSYLGLQSLSRVVHRRSAGGQAPNELPLDPWRSFRSGYLTNVLNPSLAAFYLVVVPQFVPREASFARSVLTLTSIHVSIAFPWHLAWAYAGSTLARVLSRRGPRQVLDALTGIALLWLAVLIAIR